MKIALDIDGCLRDLMASLVYSYKLHYPTDEVVPISEWNQYDIAPYFPIGKDIYNWAFKDHAKEVFLENAPAFPYVYDYMSLLNIKGHKLSVLSYQNTTSFGYTCNWLNLGLISFLSEVRIMINDTSKKGAGKEDTNYDLYLEDCGETIQKMLEKGKNVVCMNQSWNIDMDLDCKRVDNFKEFYRYVIRK